MRNLKKFLALVLAMMMALSLMVTVNAANSYADSASINPTYAEAVDLLDALGVVKGDDVGTFRPTDPITRGEVAALLYRAATGDTSEKGPEIYKDYNWFADVHESEWFAPYVNFCANAEWIKGDAGYFNPYDNITGYEVLAMVLRAVGYDKNHEFEGATWSIQTARIARLEGVTQNIAEGTLGQPATRERVAEMIFQAIQIPTVQYNMLTQYTKNVLVAANTTTTYVKNGETLTEVAYPETVYSTLLYEVFSVVGKHDTLKRDTYGRPIIAWVKDQPNDSVALGTKYVPNCETPIVNARFIDARIDSDDAWVAEKVADLNASAPYAPYTVSMTPVKVYDNSITECNLTKDINKDDSIEWSKIREWLNGKRVDEVITNDNNNPHTARSGKLDALHTTVDYIGATGRTTEIYKLDDGTWDFVYIDTFLGKVVATREAIRDTAGHTIRNAEADVAIGYDVSENAPLKTLTLNNSKRGYTVGQLVLVQTPNGDRGANKDAADGTYLDRVDSPERAPLTPVDVPETANEFIGNSEMLATAPTTERVTITATVGARDSKMGVIANNGKTYMASNTFLAARDFTSDSAVLKEYYDVKSDSLGINNNLIGRTYDLVLDHHGYIVGMKEVTSVEVPVGVITSIDADRIGSGKYVSTVEAFMTDGTTKSFQIIDMTAAEFNKIAAAEVTDPISFTMSNFKYFTGLTEADNAWKANGVYEDLGLGSLVMFAQVSIDGNNYWYIADYDSRDVADTYMDGFTNITKGVKGDVVDDDKVNPGMANTLTDAEVMDMNSNSTIFVAEYEYRYNTVPGQNTGSNVNKTYRVYEGFKKIPSVTGATGGDNILYQQLEHHPSYVLVYAKDADNEYILRNQATITVDDSYLVLSRGATYETYSTYNALKNGQPATLEVSNMNDELNRAIEAAMADHELIVVQSRNNRGYITAIAEVSDLAASNDVAKANCGIQDDGSNFTGLATPIIVAGDDADGDISISGEVLTQKISGGNDRFLTIADNCIVKIVNLDLQTSYDSTLSAAVQYHNNVGTNGRHDLVFELNELGYVCCIYIID
ncbi:MAG: S-layer homology domain-containing protein [Muribaculaceae bacterium]|nr:S-layer homology domain-containing protein [Muribaculaceae bacterium]